MAHNPKYIVVDFPLGEYLFIFPDCIAHREIANRFLPLPTISAGFISFASKTMPYCYGKSTSLGLDSRPEDSQLLAGTLDLDK